MLRPALVASLVPLCPAITLAQVPAKDIPAARDHAMVGRYEGSVIAFQKTRDYNIDLSRKRVQSVIKALTGAGIAANRLAPFGAGTASPVATNETEAGQALNRRVEIVKR